MDARNLQGRRGKLIAIEGIDQSGKRTQSQILARRLRARGYTVSVWNFPDYTTPLGRELRAYLSGKIRLDYHVVHLLYAANKWERAHELNRQLSEKRIVIVNRYSPSNLVYGLAHGLPLHWLSSLEEALPKPDLVMILDVSPRTSFDRKERRRDLHETDLRYLRKVRSEYLRLAKKHQWKLIEGENDPEAVSSVLLNHALQVLQRKQRMR